jgi:hypothetical protein
MSNTETNNNSDIIQMQSLQLEFKVVLGQYEQAYANYINALNNATSDTNFVVLNNRAVSGQSLSNVQNISSDDDCMALCSQNSQCSGATFSPNSSSCSLQSGDVNIITQTGFSAIVPQLTQYADNLNKLNERLLLLNLQMRNIMETSQPANDQANSENLLSYSNLQEIYAQLIEERQNLAELLNKTNTTNVDFDNSSITATSKNMQFALWAIFAIILVAITIYLFLLKK